MRRPAVIAFRIALDLQEESHERQRHRHTPRLRTNARRLWSTRARDYAELQEIQFLPLYESVLLRPEVAAAGASLDVGCGPGLAAQVFAQKITNVSGIDASAAFIAIARQRLPGRDFREGEMEDLPHADASFDVVTGFNAFQYASSPRSALSEARRVLRPGGAIVIATWGLPQDCEAAGHLKALGGLMPPPPPGAPGPFALSDEVSLRALPVKQASRRSPWWTPRAPGPIRISRPPCAGCSLLAPRAGHPPQRHGVRAGCRRSIHCSLSDAFG